MIQQHIERIKERPRDERIAIAGTIAIGVMCVLFIGWTIFFFGTIGGAAVPPGAATSTPETE